MQTEPCQTLFSEAKLFLVAETRKESSLLNIDVGIITGAIGAKGAGEAVRGVEQDEALVRSALGKR